MKLKISFLFLIFLGLFSLTSFAQAGDYVIDGTATAEQDGKKAFLYDVLAQTALDSTVVNNAKFSFKGSVNEAKFCRVFIDRIGTNIVLEPGTITVDLKDRKVSGGPMNAKLTDYANASKALIQERNDMYKSMKETITDEAAMREAFSKKMDEEWTPKYKKHLDNAMAANANSIIGGIVASDMASSFNYEAKDMNAALNRLNEGVKTSPYISAIMRLNEAQMRTEVGQKFVDFSITQPNGTVVSLSDYVGKGKYVLVDFWASWCGPCRAEIPNLKEVYEKYKGDNFEILGVVVWDKLEDTLKALEKEGMTWPQILDGQRIPTDAYGIRGIPQIILFAPDGTIVAKNLRGAELREKVAEVLAK